MAEPVPAGCPALTIPDSSIAAIAAKYGNAVGSSTTMMLAPSIMLDRRFGLGSGISLRERRTR